MPSGQHPRPQAQPLPIAMEAMMRLPPRPGRRPMTLRAGGLRAASLHGSACGTGLPRRSAQAHPPSYTDGLPSSGAVPDSGAEGQLRLGGRLAHRLRSPPAPRCQPVGLASCPETAFGRIPANLRDRPGDPINEGVWFDLGGA